MSARRRPGANPIMHASNAALITSFYEAFRRRDGAAMAASYHSTARFSDPVFPSLDAREAGAMWRMFCERGSDLAIDFGEVEASETEGRARWNARYSFSGTGRRVHNRIEARFRFRDGLIVDHRDSFSLWRWTRMALGVPGVLLGWSPLVRGKVRSLARKQLHEYMDGQAA